MCFAGNDVWANDPGVRFIQSRGKVVCGTDLDPKTYAHKDEDGVWQGIDADICRMFASAIIGRDDNFEMKHIDADKASEALRNGTVDVMLGATPYSASVELNKKYTPAALMYFDRQMFLTFDVGANSLEAYKGKKVCAVTGTDDLNNVQEYSAKYGLDLNILFFPSERTARSAFLLKRCDLLTGNGVALEGVLKKTYTETAKLKLIPETIAVKPIYVYVDNKNETLKLTLKWIVNALTLAEDKDINSANVELFVVDKNSSIRNLLGEDDKIWKRLAVYPTWLKTYIKEHGNYRDFIDKNLKEPLKENRLYKDGGAITPFSFL
jgi:general L-amino acid transport system substrate-binding protein